MDLLVFDLDGTLLNRQSEISPFTRQTLALLKAAGVGYTVATGRTLHTAQPLLQGHGFELPHIYKNGVMTWDPGQALYIEQNLLSAAEVRYIMEAFMEQGVSPFVFTLDSAAQHAIYHPPLRNPVEHALADMWLKDGPVPLLPLTHWPDDVAVSHISAIGSDAAIRPIAELVDADPALVAYTGTALEGQQLCWIDVHHSAGSKGAALQQLKAGLDVSRVLCFGDSDNDLSMFAIADECYAPENAKDPLKEAATAVIGHHDEDGIARFLAERYGLSLS